MRRRSGAPSASSLTRPTPRTRSPGSRACLCSVCSARVCLCVCVCLCVALTNQRRLTPPSARADRQCPIPGHPKVGDSCASLSHSLSLSLSLSLSPLSLSLSLTNFVACRHVDRYYQSQAESFSMRTIDEGDDKAGMVSRPTHTCIHTPSSFFSTRRGSSTPSSATTSRSSMSTGAQTIPPFPPK